MSILDKLGKLEESTIYKLQYNGKIVGFRVKYYRIEIDSFEYYDFEISYVKSTSLRDYLNKHSKEFETLSLVEHNGLACTKDEIDGAISVKEFKDESNSEKVLNAVISVMEGGKNNV